MNKSRYTLLFFMYIFCICAAEENPEYVVYKSALSTPSNGCAAAYDKNNKYYLGLFLDKKFVPFEAKEVKLDHKNNVPNPLLGKEVSVLKDFKRKPVVVFKGESKMYLTNTLANQDSFMELFSTESFFVNQDDGKHLPAEIIDIEYIFFTKTQSQEEDNYFLLQLCPQGGKWGDQGSCFVMLKLVYREIEQEVKQNSPDRSGKKIKKQNIREHYFQTIDRIELSDLAHVAQVPIDKINVKTVYWDDLFRRLYIGLDIDVHDEQSDNYAIALIAHLDEDKLNVVPLLRLGEIKKYLPSSVDTYEDISVNKINFLHLSTGLAYIFLSGYLNGQPFILTFPVANCSYVSSRAAIVEQHIKTDKRHGAIASMQAEPSAHFYKSGMCRFIGKAIQEKAEAEDFEQFNIKAVSPDVSQFSKILHSYGVADTLIIIHGDLDGNSLGAVYAQAIFDISGHIAGWTEFRPLESAPKGLSFFSVNGNDMHFTYFKKDESGYLQSSTPTWKLYAENSEDLNGQEKQEWDSFDAIAREFPIDQGGITSMWYYKVQQENGQKRSLLATSHSSKLVWSFLDNEQDLFVMNTSMLQDIDIVSCTELYKHEENYYMLVGGTYGVAILRNDNYSGWHIKQEDAFGELHSCKARKICDFEFARQLLTYEGQLFVLARSGLYVCTMEDAIYKEDKPSFDQIASSKNFGSIKDILVCGKFLIIASNYGCFYTHVDDLTNWKKLPYNPEMRRAQALYFIQSADKSCGQLYLTTLQEDSSAFVYRFFVDCNNDTIKQVVEPGFKGQPISYVLFGGYRHRFCTDGKVLVSYRGGMRPIIHFMPTFIAGKQIASSKGYYVPIPWEESKNVAGVVQDAITGNWIAAGSFGISVYK